MLELSNPYSTISVIIMIQLGQMKKELNGREVAGFVKERQLKAVRGLIQQHKIQPKLAIIRTNPDPVVNSYMKIKRSYGEDIGVAVDIYTIEQSEVLELIDRLNSDDTVHGIIVQIPLPDPSQNDEVLNRVATAKDVDGLAEGTGFGAPTAVAINWLLAAYNVDLKKSNVVVVGRGRLVGGPLIQMWEDSGISVTVVDKDTKNTAVITSEADVLVAATGVAHLIKPGMVKPDAVIVDAGVSTDSNGLVGDVDDAVRDMPLVVVTPKVGGVGPLTVTALYENVIIAARSTVDSTKLDLKVHGAI